MHFGKNVLEITANIAQSKTDVSLHSGDDVHYMIGLKLTVSFSKILLLTCFSTFNSKLFLIRNRINTMLLHYFNNLLKSIMSDYS